MNIYCLTKPISRSVPSGDDVKVAILAVGAGHPGPGAVDDEDAPLETERMVGAAGDLAVGIAGAAVRIGTLPARRQIGFSRVTKYSG